MLFVLVDLKLIQTFLIVSYDEHHLQIMHLPDAEFDEVIIFFVLKQFIGLAICIIVCIAIIVLTALAA